MKRKLFKILFSLLGVFLVLVGSYSLSFKQKVNDLSLQSYYKKGVFHIHSSFSDGRGSIAEISRNAKRSNLDFVILTDHGRPNLAAAAATSWINDILLIGASEFSLNEGHLAAAGYQIPSYIFPPEAREAINEVNRDQGITFISHPHDRKIPWTAWQVRGFTGIEIMSLYQMAKKNLLYGMTFFPLQYLFNPDQALTSLISYPEKEMRIWDRFNRIGKYFGIYALDSHAKLQINNKFSLHFPSYGATFQILNIYVKVERELEKDPHSAAAAIIAAMRSGNFFNVIESLAPANGFENVYRERDGRLVDMGGDAQNPGGTLIFKLPFAFATDIVVKKNGEIFKIIRANNLQELSVPISRAGVYRSEISLAAGRFNKLPWIMTNPIYVAQSALEKVAPENVTAIIPAEDENYFRVEKNSRSNGVLLWDAQGEEDPITGLNFTLQPEAPGQVDFWVALAHRQKLAAAGCRGFVFEARAGTRMRFWLQFRTGSGRGEAAYQHSFLVEETWRKIAIPFSNFHCLYGQPALPDPDAINAFFFLIDNGNAFPGAQGEIFFRQIGLY
ncbi:MAG: hypothetical protein WCL37_00825 [Chrysiogenales bacterium]